MRAVTLVFFVLSLQKTRKLISVPMINYSNSAVSLRRALAQLLTVSSAINPQFSVNLGNFVFLLPD